MNDVKLLNGTKYFFKQEARRVPRRDKKNLDDIPPNIRYAKTKANTISSTRSGEEGPDGSSDIGTHDGTIDGSTARNEPEPPPQELNDRLGLVSFSDTAAPVVNNLPEDNQRLVFENYKSLASLTLTRLGELLDFFELKKDHIFNLSKTVEVALLSEFKDLSCDVLYVLREWQTLSARTAWDREQRKLGRDSSDDSKSVIDVTASSEVNLDKQSIMKAEKDGRTSSQGQLAGGGSKAKLKLRSSKSRLGLGNIAEDEEMDTSKAKTDRRGSMTSVQGGKRTRIERFRPMLDQMSKTSLSERSRRPGEEGSVMSISEDSGAARGYYVSVIQFALSSRLCEENGWIVHDDDKADLERQTVLEWARQRLQTSIKRSQEQKNKDAEIGHDKIPEMTFYGEWKKERPKPKQNSLPKGLYPEVPNIPMEESDRSQTSRRLFTAVSADGSTSVYYPSGNLAIMSSQAGMEREGYYISVFADTPAKTMLANFTPSGRGACYYTNGVVRFLSTDKEVMLLDENGACRKRWAWPPTLVGKLPATVQVQLCGNVIFRCISRSQMNITYTHGKHTMKFNMTHQLIQPEPDDAGKLQSGIVFTSQSAKDLVKGRSKMAQALKDPKERKKSRKEKKVSVEKKEPTIEEVSTPDPEDSFELESEKELFKLSNKIQGLVSRWMTHYRDAVGVRPQTKSANQSQRSKSAKSTPGDILRDLGGSKVTTVVPKRAGTAPASRDFRPHTSTERPKTSFKSRNDMLTLKLGLTEMSLPLQSRGSPRRMKSPEHGMDHDDDDHRPRGICPTALSRYIQGLQENLHNCRCSKHHMPALTDIEYDIFIHQLSPPEQMIIVLVTSSLHPSADDSSCQRMLEQLYDETNKVRSMPCSQSQGDPFRIFKYDVNTCTHGSDHTQPLLLWRHNVVPGMILMYQAGKLLFADHIFNGYGNARKDFTKQVMKTKREAMATGQSLPDDFRFSPQRGRSGLRMAWGGQIGGAGIDSHGRPGTDMKGTFYPVRRATSASSTSNSDFSLPRTMTRGQSSITAETLLSSTYRQTQSADSYTQRCLTAHS